MFRSLLKGLEFIHDPYDSAVHGMDTEGEEEAPMGTKADDWDSFSNALETHGWRHTGEGWFASVWTHPKYPYVLKFFKVDDRAYIDWVKFCKSQPHNIFLPKFRGEIVSVSPRIKVVRIEKLERVSHDFYHHAVTQLFNVIENKWSTWPWDDKYQKDFLTIAKWLHTTKHGTDFSEDNIMKRPGSNIPVFIDPIS